METKRALIINERQPELLENIMRKKGFAKVTLPGHTDDRNDNGKQCINYSMSLRKLLPEQGWEKIVKWLTKGNCGVP